MATSKVSIFKKETVDLFVKLLQEEVLLILKEPPPEDFVMELAAWRTLYKINVELPSLKARDMALKSTAVKRARIEEAEEHIEHAFEQCIRSGRKPTQLNIEAELCSLQVDRIFSDEKSKAKKAVVKSSTIKTYLSKRKKLPIEEKC